MSAAKKKPAAEKRRPLEELLKGANAYEKAVAAHVLSRHDATLEAAIVEHQRTVGACLRYVATEARKRSRGATCVVMADDEVFGLAVHYFLDGETPSGIEAGAAVDAADPAKAQPTKPKAKAKKPAKAKPKAAFEQLCFSLDFGGAAE